MVPSLLWLMLESAAILYSKGKVALQADDAARFPYHDKQADYISIAAYPTGRLVRGGYSVFSYGDGRRSASAGTPAFAGAFASGTAVGIPADDGDARRIAWG